MMKKMIKEFTQFDDLLEKISQSEDAETSLPLEKSLNKLFSENKDKLEEYYLKLFSAKDEKIHDLVYTLQNDKKWHDFLIRQLKHLLKSLEETPEDLDEFKSELLDDLVEYNEEDESEKTIYDEVQKILISYLQHPNIKLRETCFNLIAYMATPKSKFILSELERLKEHKDWKIKFQAYYTENWILGRKGKYGLPILLRIRAMFNSKYNELLKTDPEAIEKEVKQVLEELKITYDK